MSENMKALEALNEARSDLAEGHYLKIRAALSDVDNLEKKLHDVLVNNARLRAALTAQSSMKQREVDHGDRLSACVKHCRALVKHLADMDSGSTDAMAINAVCDDLMKQREVVEGLITALQNLMHVIENCSVTAGHCFCGDSMDRHSHPMDCGHTATDMGAKYADDAYETGKQALAAAEKIGGK